jgi:hypothetical protein
MSDWQARLAFIGLTKRRHGDGVRAIECATRHTKPWAIIRNAGPP